MLQFLLDTHIAVRWLADPKKLSRDQARTLADRVRMSQPVGVSSITLIEIAVLMSDGSGRIKGKVDDLFKELETNPVFCVLPLTFEIASEVASLGASLRDPADRTIVATARVHRLKLITSDQRIIESGLVSVIC